MLLFSHLNSDGYGRKAARTRSDRQDRNVELRQFRDFPIWLAYWPSQLIRLTKVLPFRSLLSGHSLFSVAETHSANFVLASKKTIRWRQSVSSSSMAQHRCQVVRNPSCNCHAPAAVVTSAGHCVAATGQTDRRLLARLSCRSQLRQSIYARFFSRIRKATGSPPDWFA